MKNFITILMIGSALLLAACENGAKEHKGTVDIKDASATGSPKGDVTGHKAFDVDVYKVDFMGGAYEVRYYETENDSLKYHGGMYGPKDTTDTYNKADYNWQKDTVAVRLYNTTTKKEHTIRLYGHGGSNGMLDDK